MKDLSTIAAPLNVVKKSAPVCSFEREIMFCTCFGFT